MTSPMQLWLFFFLLIFIIVSPISSYTMHHPLNPLSREEFVLVQKTVQRSYPSSSHNITFHYVGLDDPAKPLVLSWLSNPTSTKTPPRRALVAARIDKETHEIVVDLPEGTIFSDEVYKGPGFPLLTGDEQTAAIQLPLTYSPFIESAKKRGINISEVVCSSFTRGWFGKNRSDREIKLQCFQIDNSTVNLYLRPIEGVQVVVDLDEMKIVGYSDDYTLPVPKADGTDYRLKTQKPPLGPRTNAAIIVQPHGPGFQIDGHTIRGRDT